VQSSRTLDEITRELPQFSRSLNEFEVDTRVAPPQGRSQVSASLLRGAWANADARLVKWQTALIAENKSLEGDLRTLAVESPYLDEERQRLDGNQVQSGLVSIIDRVREQIHRAIQAGRARQNALLAIQADLTELEVKVHVMQQSLRETARVSPSQLFTFDSRPIWRLPDSGSFSNIHPVALGTAPTRSSYFLLYLAKLMSLLGLGYVVFLLTFLLLRRWVAGRVSASSSSFADLKAFLHRPFSAALVPTFIAGDLFRGQIELDALPLVLPLLRVIPVLLPARFTPLIWGLAGLFVLDWVAIQYSPAATFSMRVVQLVRIGLTVVWLLWARRALQSEPRQAGLRWLWPAYWIALGLVGVALVSSATGATALARYLTSGLLRAAFGSIILYGFFHVLHAFLRILMESRTADAGARSALGESGVVTGKLTVLMKSLALLAIAVVVIGAFELAEPLAFYVRTALAEPVSMGAITFTFGSIVIIVVTLTIGVLLSRILRIFLASGLYGRIPLQRGTTEVISKLVHYTILAIALVVALSASGIDLDRFTLLVGALGVGLGFGLQNVVNNFICGLILLFERPLKVGDTVTVNTISGMVTDIGIRSIRIRTWDGADVSVPNGNVVSKELTNWKGLDEQRGFELTVGVAYGTDAARVIRILTETAEQHRLVLKYPAPSALFAGFGDSSLNFTLRYWALVRDWIEVNSEMHAAVYQRLGAEGIEIPFPQREFRLKDAAGLFEQRHAAGK
jgi:small-conductance mechanosensitive channel